MVNKKNITIKKKIHIFAFYLYILTEPLILPIFSKFPTFTIIDYQSSIIVINILMIKIDG